MGKSRPTLFKWRHFEPAVITCAVGWYLRFSLSYRNVEELLTERGLPADHTTVWHWVQCYAPELNKRCRRELKPTNGSWRVDETYVRVKGKWTYLLCVARTCFTLLTTLCDVNRPPMRSVAAAR
jgi:transposase-like protein